MGYFNIFYKITRIIDMLTRKRNRRAIMVILIIIAVIFILHNKGYCAQGDSEFTTDTTYFMLEEYNNILDNFKLKFYSLYFSDNAPVSISNFDGLFEKILQGYIPYLYAYTRPSDGYQFYRVYLYNTTYNKTLVDTSLVYNDYMRVPSTAYNITIPNGQVIYNLNLNNNSFGSFVAQQDYNAAVPQIMLYKIPSQFIEMMQAAGYLVNPDTENIVDIKELLEEQNNKLDAINDSLTNTTYDENVVDFDTDSVDNVNDTEITGLFTGVIGSFSNALITYGGTITKIIPLPHGGQIEIPSNIVSSHLGSLTALVEAFWYFVFGIYLFRFVSNLIHKIKTGDILNGYTNDNEIITSSML